MVYATKGRYEFKNGRPSSVYTVTKVDGNSMIHPNEKPVRLFQGLIKDITSVGELVFDPFSGSGACSVACKIERRDFIACDLGENYVKLGNKRVLKESVNIF
jgi:DNA modification methylase